MPKSKPSIRDVRSQLTRQKLYDTAVSLFLKKGYEKVTVDEICEKIGLTKGAFYSHFKSKDQIVLERMLAVDEHYRTDILPKVAGVKSAADRLLTFIRLLLYYMHELGKTTVKTAYYTQIGYDQRVTGIMTEKRTLYKIIQELVSEAQEKGELRDDLSSAELTHIIMHSIRGIVYNWCLSTSKFDIRESADNLVKILSTGLRKK